MVGEDEVKAAGIPVGQAWKPTPGSLGFYTGSALQIYTWGQWSQMCIVEKGDSRGKGKRQSTKEMGAGRPAGGKR